MSATPKASRDIPAEEPARSLEFVEKVAILYKQGVECAAELQNRTLDCAMQHNKAMVELWKEMAENLPWAPRGSVFDGYAGTLNRFAAVQKAAIALAVDQAGIFVAIVKNRTAAAGKTVETMSRFARQSFQQSVAAQKKMAEATIAETKSALDEVRERFPVPGAEAVTESIWKGLDTIIDAQKDVLETASSRWVPEAETVSAA